MYVGPYGSSKFMLFGRTHDFAVLLYGRSDVGGFVSPDVEKT